MNLLIEDAPGFIEVGGNKLKIKTDFAIWVKFLIAIEQNNELSAVNVLENIFEKIPDDADIHELITAIMNWLYRPEEKRNTRAENNTTAKNAFSFDIDGNIIFCELWEYFPHLMERGISFQTGLELIRLLISNENTMMYHRAFARCGDFAGMSKEQKRYWQNERAKYAIRAKQEDIDAVFSGAF